MAEEFKVRIGAELNPTSFDNIKNQLNNIQTNPIKLTIDANNVKTELNSIKRQIQNLNGIKINIGGGVGSGSGIKNTVNDMNWAYKQMLSIQKNIGSLKLQIGGLDSKKNGSQINELRNQLRMLEADYKTIQKTFNQTNLSVDQWAKLQTVISTTEDKLAVLTSKVADARTNLANDITIKLNSNTFNNDIASLETGFNKLRVKSTEITSGMQNVKNALSEMSIASKNGDIEGLISAYERYKFVLQDVKNQISINAKSERELANAQKLRNDASNLSLQMDVWLKNNSASASQFGAKIRNLQAELRNCDATRFSGIKSEFQAITKQAELAGKATQTLGDRFKSQFSKLTTYFSASMVIMQTVRALRDMYSEVVKIDTAMTELKKVTNEADSTYKEFLSNSAEEAKKIGTTIDNYVSSTADFARLGHTFDNSQTLAKTANIYAVVGDEIDGIDEATQSIISTMTAFDVKVEDSMSIADKFNEVGNKFAISSGGIGEALTRSASSMKAANNTLDETIALVTAANTVVQDPDAVGKRLADNKSGYIG